MWDEGSSRAFATSNFGLVDRRTLLGHGATDEIIKWKLAKGRWLRSQWGVYYCDTTKPEWVTHVRAATLAAGPHALASHRTAAILLQLDGITGRIIEVTVPYRNRAVPEGAILHRTRRFLPSTQVAGVPTTSVERTLLDLAGVIPERVLEKAYMSALRQRLTTPGLVAFLVTEQGGPGVRGTKKMRRVLETADEGISGSPAEVDTAQLIRSAPIPPPILQLRIRLPNPGAK